jgi:hypothetical protein
VHRTVFVHKKSIRPHYFFSLHRTPHRQLHPRHHTIPIPYIPYQFIVVKGTILQCSANAMCTGTCAQVYLTVHKLTSDNTLWNAKQTRRGRKGIFSCLFIFVVCLVLLVCLLTDSFIFLDIRY